MTLDELKAQVADAQAKGNSQILLVVTRKTPPTHDYISVRGMGKGYVCNAQEKNGRWEVVAYFRTDTIAKTLARAD